MKVRLSAMLLSTMLVCAFAPAVAHAQAVDDPAWKKLAEAKPGHEPEHDVFELEPHGIRYTEIRMRVHGEPVHFMHLTVTFANGERQEIDLDKVVGDDHGTGALDLKGDRREITRVDVLYKALGHHHDSSFVSLWGYEKK